MQSRPPQIREDFSEVQALKRCIRRRNSQVALILAVVLISLSACLMPQTSRDRFVGNNGSIQKNEYGQQKTSEWLFRESTLDAPFSFRSRLGRRYQGGGLMGKPVIDTHRGDSVFRRDRAGKVLAYRGGAAGDAAGANSSNARTSGRGRGAEDDAGKEEEGDESQKEDEGDDDDQDEDCAGDEGVDDGDAPQGGEEDEDDEKPDTAAAGEGEEGASDNNNNNGNEADAREGSGYDNDQEMEHEDEPQNGDEEEDDDGEEVGDQNVEAGEDEEEEEEDDYDAEDDGTGRRKLQIEIPEDGYEEGQQEDEEGGQSRRSRKSRPPGVNVTIGEFTVHLHKLGFTMHSNKRKWPERTKEVMKGLRVWAKKAFGLEDVRIDADVNEFIWHKGKKHIPLRIRVRLEKIRQVGRMDRHLNRLDDALFTKVSYVHVDTFKGKETEVKYGVPRILTPAGNIVVEGELEEEVQAEEAHEEIEPEQDDYVT